VGEPAGPSTATPPNSSTSGLVSPTVAARRQGALQPIDDPVRLGGVGDVMQHAHQPQRDRPIEVQRAGSLPQDGVRILRVGLDVVGDARRVAGQQRAGVHQHHHQRVVVDVDDPHPTSATRPPASTTRRPATSI
jgi:hypothetical protein